MAQKKEPRRSLRGAQEGKSQTGCGQRITRRAPEATWERPWGSCPRRWSRSWHRPLGNTIRCRGAQSKAHRCHLLQTTRSTKRQTELERRQPCRPRLWWCVRRRTMSQWRSRALWVPSDTQDRSAWTANRRQATQIPQAADYTPRVASGKGCYERTAFTRVGSLDSARQVATEALGLAPDKWSRISATIRVHISIIDGFVTGELK